jgi:hypothetical protein
MDIIRGVLRSAQVPKARFSTRVGRAFMSVGNRSPARARARCPLLRSPTCGGRLGELAAVFRGSHRKCFVGCVQR